MRATSKAMLSQMKEAAEQQALDRKNKQQEEDLKFRQLLEEQEALKR